MSPDMEIVASLDPDWILSPSSLQSDLQPKYEAIDTDWAFLNLRSVPGMYRSIQELGVIFDREEQAQELVDEFTAFYEDYVTRNEEKESPKVLILMGLPGSYIIATENSYVGSLVELAGGENRIRRDRPGVSDSQHRGHAVQGTGCDLKGGHTRSRDQVIEMFNEDFETNDIWQHFTAVQEGRVYDLTYELFGMSAKFNYPEALEELQPMLYPENEEDAAKAKENSDNAAKAAEDSGASEKIDEETLQEITK